MKTFTIVSLISYVLAISITAFLWAIYDAATFQPVFYALPGPPPPWYSYFFSILGIYVPNFAFMCADLVVITTPIYGILFHFFGRAFSYSLISSILLALVCGATNCSLMIYAWTWAGESVKGPRGVLDSVMNSIAGITVIPVILTALLFFLILFFSRLFFSRTIS